MNSGCYQLKIEIKKDLTLKIGALGICHFKKGNYVYTGSAMKNLSQRIARHQSTDKKLHWHIDYLLANSEVELKKVVSYPSEIKEECQYNQRLISKGAEALILGFGSSDCKICPSHLVKIN
ncbi:MAG TPA: GIY-YIG nuclease family protein [Pyrinomonadaceae bacterium]|nr:GIY-YIG nuclease family protein [Pyrinomonadaceae bacterium]